jgi:hypothetical protein
MGGYFNTHSHLSTPPRDLNGMLVLDLDLRL